MNNVVAEARGTMFRMISAVGHSFFQAITWLVFASLFILVVAMVAKVAGAMLGFTFEFVPVEDGATTYDFGG